MTGIDFTYQSSGYLRENRQKENEEKMKNIVLIGMPGTGKSVVGRALADRLEYTFVDVDDLIVADAGKTLPQILRTDGLEEFLKIEARVGASLKRENTVIATGGSLVLSDEAMGRRRQG